MVAAAVIGGGVISAGVSAYSSNKANKESRRATRAANAQAEAQLEFERERLASEEARYDELMERHDQEIADWEATFGSIQDNLSDYYQNLSPDMRAAQGIQDFEAQRAQSMQRVSETLAQRGISGGGVEAATALQDSVSSAEARSGIRQRAETETRQEQQQFLNLGLAQQPGTAPGAPRGEGVSNAMAMQTQMASQQAQQAAQNASQQAQQVGQAVSDVAVAGIDYLAERFD